MDAGKRTISDILNENPMDERIYAIYRQLEERYVKIAWTHKIQEDQAEIYMKKSCRNKWCMAIANGVTTTSAFVTVVTSALKAHDVVWLWPAITSVIAVISSIITLRYKDGVLEDNAMACKQYAAKCRNLRLKYESLLVDTKANRYNIEELCKKRDMLTVEEDKLFAYEISPHASTKAVALARKALIEKKDSQTEDYEIKAIVPTHLQEL